MSKWADTHHIGKVYKNLHKLQRSQHANTNIIHSGDFDLLTGWDDRFKIEIYWIKEFYAALALPVR